MALEAAESLEEPSGEHTDLVWGLCRVLLDASLIASVDCKPQDVASVLEGAATQQHLVHGHRHRLGLGLRCNADKHDKQTAVHFLHSAQAKSMLAAI